MMIGLYQIVQSLQMFSNTEASFEELDISPSLGWVRDSVVIGKHRTPWTNYNEEDNHWWEGRKIKVKSHLINTLIFDMNTYEKCI